MNQGARKDSETVSFRLAGALLARLDELAEVSGRSRGELSRDLLVAVLQDENRLQVLDEIRALRDDVALLRTDVAATLESVLLNIAKRPKDEVQSFVAKVLRR